MNENQILIAAEVAKVLRIDKQRVYELVRTDPDFPVIKLGERQYRFSAFAIEEYLRRGGSKKAKGGDENYAR